MNNLSKYLSLFLLSLVTCSLTAQELSPKVKRLANRMNSVGAVMVGVEATFLDDNYDNGRNNSIDQYFENQRLNRIDELYGVESNQRLYTVNGRRPGSNRQYNISYNKYVFLANQRLSQIRNFRDMTDRATVAEMLTLMKHESPVVRCYAFWGLLEQHYPQSFELLMDNIDDYENVGIFNDDDLVQYKVGDFLIMLMSEGKIVNYVKKMSAEEEKQLMDYLLSNSDNQLDTRRQLILNLEPTENNYDKIRALAEKSKDASTLALLASYKKDSDLSLINNLFFKADKYAALKAIRSWPNPDFLPQLKEIQNEILGKKRGVSPNNLLMLYQALAQYPSKETVKLMEEAFKVKKTIIREHHIQYLWLALHKYPNEAFTKVFNSIRLDAYQKREALRSLEY